MWSPDSSKILTCSGDGTSKVLDAATLDTCGGSIDRLIDAIEQAAAHHGLIWAGP
jgi:WD40 repeat protein